VATALYNPFGDDDDDFKLIDMLNRHIKVCMKIVDDDSEDIPKVQDDEFWQPPPGSSSDWHPTLTTMITDAEGKKVIQRKTSDRWKQAVEVVCTPKLGRNADIVSIAEERDFA